MTCAVLACAIPEEDRGGDGTLPFQNVYITLDDNADYGFNIDEAAELRSVVDQLQNGSGWAFHHPSENRKPLPIGIVRIYPGADEVGLTLLSKLSLDAVDGLRRQQPTAIDDSLSSGVQMARSSSNCTLVVWRNISTIEAIPNYEGQPVHETVHQQVLAAGSTPIDHNGTAAWPNCGVVLLVNNFDNPAGQLEATQQPFASGRPASDYAAFLPFLALGTTHDETHTLGFADVRYSNGGDLAFVDWLKSVKGGIGGNGTFNFAYAGWNTDGNSLGTVISNALILHAACLAPLGGPLAACEVENAIFNSLRLVEDLHYQSIVRCVPGRVIMCPL